MATVSRPAEKRHSSRQDRASEPANRQWAAKSGGPVLTAGSQRVDCLLTGPLARTRGLRKVPRPLAALPPNVRHSA